MIWRIEVKDREGIFDAAGESVRKDILDLGIDSVKEVKVTSVYLIDGDLSAEQVDLIGRELLVDPIVQVYTCGKADTLAKQKNFSKTLKTVEIAYNPGVMDPVEESTLKGIRDLGIQSVRAVRTAKKYFIYGRVSDRELETIVNRVLANKLIQHVVSSEMKPVTSSTPSNISSNKFDLVLVRLREASDRELQELSQKDQLFLNLNEMKTIQNHFRQIQRDPTDCELETIAQTWSEHCHHKTFRGNIRYQEKIGGKTKTRLIKNLLKSTIVKATQKIDKPWCVSVFYDNAGVIEFDDEDNVTFKVETHNHPSALEPFGGANTGVGGVIRDSLGTGLGAKPLCNTDVFCFAPPEMTFKELPVGTLHPKRVMKGVVAGVRDYGNKMGIPTVNGAILFDRRFVGNPLVFCGNVGMIPNNRVHKKARTGDLVVVAGGRTGRDGIHGATFSSGELTQDSEVISSGAVQIGNPIQEKKLMDVLLQARDQNLFSAITDCGAGGLSSAVGEMGEHLGCRVELEKVPLKYQGLKYHEIWISESQERMVLAVPPENIAKLSKIFADEGVEASVIGQFTDTKQLEIFYNGVQVSDLSMAFLHGGIPQITKEAIFTAPKLKKEKWIAPTELTKKLLEVLGHYNVCSKEWVIRQYDHEVQGASVLKPLVGVHCEGPSDAAVLRPKLNSLKAIAVSNGINVRFGMIDPYWMAASVIDEAIRQIIAVGGKLDRIAILDNFCWGNPDKPDRLGSLVRAAEACYKIAIGYGVPFISGKDSLYNEYTEHGKSLAIPGTLLISAIGILDDASKVVSMDFKKPKNFIYVIGETREELGGSIYLDTYGLLGQMVPTVDTNRGKKIFQAVSQIVDRGLARAIHDCSEGGLGVTLAEMAFAGGLGATVRLDKVPFKGKGRSDAILFSESNSRFVIEVDPAHQKEFESTLKGIAFGQIGRVESSSEFVIYGIDKKIYVNAYIDDLKSAWKQPLAL